MYIRGKKIEGKYILNAIVAIGVFVIELLIIAYLYKLFSKVDISSGADGSIPVSLFDALAISLILVWFGVLIAYLAWAIHFYNINLGLTNEDWAAIKERINEGKARREMGEDVPEEELVEPTENPYKDETFGLPPGTIRGTLALSLLLGGFSLLIVSFGHPDVLGSSDIFRENYEFFKTAFLMMIAFYFGSKSLQYIMKPDRKSGTQIAPRGINKKTVVSDILSAPPETENAAPPPPAVDDSAFEAEPPPPPAASVPKSETTNIYDPDTLEVKNIINEFPQIKDNLNEKKLTQKNIIDAANANDIEPPIMMAVIKVESGGSGFLRDGRPKILFEGHKFYKHLKSAGEDVEALAKEHPTIIYAKWTKVHYIGGAGEHDRLDQAIKIHREAALKSASWGLFQILGEHAENLNYDSVETFVREQYESEQKHLEAFIRFIDRYDMIQLLKDRDWRGFARRYNGPGYERNNYHVKLEMAYAKYYNDLYPTLRTELIRTSDDSVQTLGEFRVLDNDHLLYTCKTLELAWRNNQINISCIPEGEYWVEKRYNTRRRNHFQILDVKGRSWILIRIGNYYTQIKGSVLVGERHIDINQDGYKDVTNSRKTMVELYRKLPKRFKLKIKHTDEVG
ncbi:DUF5675 family protein [Fulvivirgaceae bacterium BMA12]|uniref:DUF5675 family protein n=1 Tax=Agaribacillus aureus TaxID=3051825 RepID=A0ABT8KZP8_9BACT|nr:DUF5675 family protein [Fulvivirgaceae bacterium BMA12]